MKALFLVFVLPVALFASACHGPPSQLDACKHFCDKQGDCVKAASSEIAACKTNCDANNATWQDNDKLIETNCANAGSVKDQIYSCYGDFCDSGLAQQCADNVAQNKCTPK